MVFIIILIVMDFLMATKLVIIEVIIMALVATCVLGTLRSETA